MVSNGDETGMVGRNPPAVLVVICLWLSSPAARAEDAREVTDSLLLSAVPLLPAVTAAERRSYLPIFAAQAREHGVPPELIDAVAFVESGYDLTMIGKAGEIGLMQVMPSTAAMLGFQGTRAQLAEPATNIRYGVEYLARALRTAGGDICRALMKYRAGQGEDTLSPRSVAYCRRVRKHLAALGSPLSAKVSMPIEAIRTSSDQPGSNVKRAPNAVKRGQLFWAAHEARIRALTAQVHAKWARIAQHRGG